MMNNKRKSCTSKGLKVWFAFPNPYISSRQWTFKLWKGCA